MRVRIILLAVFSTLQYTVWAQEVQLIQQLSEDEQSVIQAIALYPENQRTSILEATSTPGVLVRIQNIRKRTESQFRELLADLSEDDQKKLFNLSRYPALIEEICSGSEKKTRAMMNTLLAEFPEEIHEHADFANRKYFSLLVTINDLYHDAQQAFEDMIGNYPEETQQAYRELIKLPEVVSILVDNINMAVLLGDIYINNPVRLKGELDSLNVIIAEQKAKELAEWKQQLEKNPEVMSEYEQASRKFAHEQGYCEVDYNTHYKAEIYIYDVWHPYPYWFGYPWWYSYECWYHYPWWYHWGYYYGPGNAVVFVGMPSSFFMHWHFSHYSHFYNYPRFTDYVVDYYYSHRKSNTSVTTEVGIWRTDILPELPKNWFENDGDRVDRIREYGKSKMDQQSVTHEAGDKMPFQLEYHEYNPQTPRPKKEPVPGKRPVYLETERAKIHHQNTWERVQPQKVMPKVQPAPIQTKPRSPPVKKKKAQKIKTGQSKN